MAVLILFHINPRQADQDTHFLVVGISITTYSIHHNSSFIPQFLLSVSVGFWVNRSFTSHKTTTVITTHIRWATFNRVEMKIVQFYPVTQTQRSLKRYRWFHKENYYGSQLPKVPENCCGVVIRKKKKKSRGCRGRVQKRAHPTVRSLINVRTRLYKKNRQKRAQRTKPPRRE